MAVRGWRWKGAVLLVAVAVGGCGAGPDTGDGGPAHTTSADPAKSSPDDTPRTGELLLASAPHGWTVTGSLHTQSLRMAEYQPPDQPQDRVERLRIEAQSGDPLPDPINFVLGVSKSLQSRCEGYQDLNVSSGLENGYPASVELMICPKFRDSETGQVMLTKAIRGTEKFYVITRRMMTPPMKGQGPPLTAQAMAEWTTLLKHVRVCDTRGDQHPCPAFADSGAASVEPATQQPAPSGS